MIKRRERALHPGDEVITDRTHYKVVSPYRGRMLLRVFTDLEDTADHQHEVSIFSPIPQAGDRVSINGDDWVEDGFYSGEVLYRHFSYLPEPNEQPMVDLIVRPIHHGG